MIPLSNNKRKQLTKCSNLEPGGWIEQTEPDIDICCDDGTLPADSMLAEWGGMFKNIAQYADRPLDTCFEMRSRIEAAGFINVHQQDYKCPIGTWPSLPVYKDAGRMGMQQFKAGMEGWAMMLLTRVGYAASQFMNSDSNLLVVRPTNAMEQKRGSGLLGEDRKGDWFRVAHLPARSPCLGAEAL